MHRRRVIDDVTDPDVAQIAQRLQRTADDAVVQVALALHDAELRLVSQVDDLAVADQVDEIQRDALEARIVGHRDLAGGLEPAPVGDLARRSEPVVMPVGPRPVLLVRQQIGDTVLRLFDARCGSLRNQAIADPIGFRLDRDDRDGGTRLYWRRLDRNRLGRINGPVARCGARRGRERRGAGDQHGKCDRQTRPVKYAHVDFSPR